MMNIDDYLLQAQRLLAKKDKLLQDEAASKRLRSQTAGTSVVVLTDSDSGSGLDSEDSAAEEEPVPVICGKGKINIQNTEKFVDRSVHDSRLHKEIARTGRENRNSLISLHLFWIKCERLFDFVFQNCAVDPRRSKPDQFGPGSGKRNQCEVLVVSFTIF